MGYSLGPRADLDPQTQFLSVIFGRPASKPFIILTKLLNHVVAGCNIISVGISKNMVSNTLPPVLGLYFSRYNIGHICHNEVNQLIRFNKICYCNDWVME